MTVKQELNQLLYKQQEESYSHISIEEEFAFYRNIANGNLDVLQGDLLTENREHMGILSHNPLQNRKYHLVILVAMITRFCIERGLEPEESYTLSDLFIRKIDSAISEKQLETIKIDVITEFTNTMHAIKQGKNYSYHVRHGIDYISKHITESISGVDVANALGLNRDYLSHLFQKETGCPLQRFILRKKCETSCYMLKNSSISCTDISSFLGFASCSHYIKGFREEYGITPGKYRTQGDF